MVEIGWKVGRRPVGGICRILRGDKLESAPKNSCEIEVKERSAVGGKSVEID